MKKIIGTIYTTGSNYLRCGGEAARWRKSQEEKKPGGKNGKGVKKPDTVLSVYHSCTTTLVSSFNH